MRRGFVLAVVAALLMSAIGSSALAQEAPEAERYCADSDTTAYQYGCDGPGSPDCGSPESQQQYADGGIGGCGVDQYQYDACADEVSCDSAQTQNSIAADSFVAPLPPASVRNVVVAAADSVSEDATEVPRALATAGPEEPADNVALAAEGEPAAEPPMYASEDFEDGTTPQSSAAAPAAAPPPASAAAGSIQATQSTESARPIVGAAEPVRPAEDAPPAETSDDFVDRDRGSKEAYGASAASGGDAPIDRFVVPLFALAGSTLLIGGGLLFRRIVG